MSAESIRLPGFYPLKEAFWCFEQVRMTRIIAGRQYQSYSRWTLHGIPSGVCDTTAAIGIFPTPASIQGYFPDAIVNKYTDISDLEYWRKIKDLTLPYSVTAEEQQKYGDFESCGDKILQLITIELVQRFMPSVMIVFSKTAGFAEESACLICPNVVPPSTALRFMQEQAKLHLNLH